MEGLDTFGEIRKIVQREIPQEAGLTKIEFEGPFIIIYVKNLGVLIENSEPIRKIVHEIKKRIIVRADPSVRKPENEAKHIIENIIPKEAEVTDITFDEEAGEVIILAKKPGLVIGKGGSTLKDIVHQTGWRANIIRSPPLKSKIIEQTVYYINRESEYRLKFLRQVGRRIHRPIIYENEWVVLSALGGFREVGRQAMLVQTLNSKVLIDCGVKPGVNDFFNEFPRLEEVDLEDLDAVIITHAHLDHCGLVPLLFKYGYSGPVYC
ncbi:MAG: MBL fold metallo-hydrolase, partial [Candidatus Methanomethyliaceae archaeon]|nr:MBL fold metallo-hydrolase [Candidatus Methanomethyliaceae archaeon]